MGSFSLAFTLFPQNDQVCPLRRPHLCLGLFGVLLPRTLPLRTKNYNYNYTSTLQKAPQEGGPTRTPYKSTTTTTTTTTPAPYKQYQKREAKPEPYPYKSTTTTTTTTTPAPY